MYTLVYSSAYTEYKAAQVATLEEAEDVCRVRYGVHNPKFGQNDAGMLYTVAYDEDGIVMLWLREIGESE